MYRIQGWFPSGSEQRGVAGFNVLLKKEWFEMVKQSTVDQDKIDNMIANLGKQMLHGHGWTFIEKPEQHIQVWWYDGYPIIKVPGNACTLGYEPFSQFGAREGEAMLSPHNMDTLKQASLALTVFLKIADYVETCKK